MQPEELANRLSTKIRNVPDFPKPGIQFKDITTLLGDGRAFQDAVDWMAIVCRGREVDRIAGIEARGFIFGASLANRLGLGFVPLRKPGKLPAATLRETYSLEYGQDAIEMHADAVSPRERVLVVDDLLATGGTMAAACRLIEQRGARVVGCLILVELAFLKGRQKLKGYEVDSLIRVDGD